MLSFAFVYAASTIGLFFVVLTSVIVYLAAKKIEEVDDDRKKKVLIAAMGACLFILIFLKYLSGLSIFTQGNLMIFGNEMTIQGVIKKYLLPIGMSYYTLQVISYLLDVYWGRMDAEEDYWKVLLFTCYFPQLVQGPISKYSELAPELFKEHKLDWKNIKYGVQLMLWGFFKKMLIADRIGVYVNAIFHEGVTPYGLTAWIGLVFYGIQLYCDFSGGIDVIRGVSECFGIGLKENFRQPYFSLSLGEFWRRWHISLGTWMKDYIFYPVSMAGWMSTLKKKLKKVTSRKTATRVAMAIADLLVFALVGIHHLKYHGQTMAMQIPEMEVLNTSAETKPYCICGSLCTVADVLVREVELPIVSRNDVILFHRCGAYSVTEGSALFLSRKMPEVYLYNEAVGLEKMRGFISTASINRNSICQG